MEQLDTDSCRGTVPMEPPMPNCSMHHREPKSEIDDTGHFLLGALCTIAARSIKFDYFSRLHGLIQLYNSCFTAKTGLGVLYSWH